MKRTAVLAGGLAAALWGGLALADECPSGMKPVVEPDPYAVSDGAGSTATDAQGTPTRVVCKPIDEGVGGSGSTTVMQETTSVTDETAPVTTPPPPPPTYAAVPVTPVYTTPPKKADKNDMRGLTLMAGGGVEAYAGSLSSRIAPGAGWGVTAAIKPTRIFGVELGYTGSANDITRAALGGIGGAGGPDLIRNGGQVALTLGLTAANVQPYILGGVGVDAYTVRGGQGAGFRNDVSGQAPLGGGIRGHWGHFTADARANYNFTFAQDFAEIGGLSTSNVGRYMASMNLGATF